MTETTDSPLDLSILAQVTPEPEPDEKPDTRGTGPAGKAVGEESPRRRTRRTPPPPPEPGPRVFVRDDEELIPEYKPGILVKPLTDAYMTLGAMILPINQPIGTSIMQNANECAKALDNAAKVDKRFRKYIMRALGTSAWVPVLIAHMPIATTVAVTLMPSVRDRVGGVQLPEQQPGETINPVSNGYTRR